MKSTVEIASVPDRDEVIAEVWCDDAMVAEMRHGESGLQLEIYQTESGAPWSFDLQSWQSALAEAQRRLR